MDFRIIFVIFILLNFVLEANEQIEITANQFQADEKAKLSILEGNVLIKKGKDILKSEKLIIYMDDAMKPLRYEASGKPSFVIFLEGKKYNGKGDKFVYNSQKDVYEILGNAFIEEEISKKRLFGSKIIIDRKKQNYQVNGAKDKPVRFVFELEDNKIK